MSFSSIAIEQRDKEIKALKTFLVYSTVGSLVLHIAVLASGIGNLLARAPELESEPIEMTFVEPEVKETPIKEEKKPSPEDNKLGAGKVLTSSAANSGGGSVAASSSTQLSPQIQAQTPVIVQPAPQAPVPVSKLIEKPIVPQAFTPVQKQVETQQRQSVTPPQPQKEDPVVSNEPQKPVNNIPKEPTLVQKPVEKTQPQESQSSPKVATINTPVESSTSTQESSDNLRNTLDNIRDSRPTQTPSANSSSEFNKPADSNNSTIASGSGTDNPTENATGTGNGVGTGTGSGSGTGTGNATGSGRGEIAAAPTKPKIPQGNGGSGGSGDGRAACKDCKVKYPESAKRRKAEGRVEVAVDTDKDGNVTNVRLTRSSGDRELDEEHLRQAREWKLKPAEQGRQGVKIATEYSMKGSRRDREVQQRQEQRARAERERQRQAASSDNNNSGDQTPGRRRRNLEASGESASSNEESRSRSLNQGLPQPTEVSPPKNESETPTQVRNSEESSINNPLGGGVENNSGSAPIPPTPSEVTGDVRTSGEQQPPTKRKKRELNQSNQSSDSTSQLRGVLRRSGESAPAAPSSDAEGE
ncbi:MAG: TonB family protein [Spirirestis rafaelensis WJT71-NPBG6]|jgi:TonB family protein|nr:TonB family protein [Spirirestis rafaelensis WJT71-NPBG6]